MIYNDVVETVLRYVIYNNWRSANDQKRKMSVKMIHRNSVLSFLFCLIILGIDTIRMKFYIKQNKNMYFT